MYFELFVDQLKKLTQIAPFQLIESPQIYATHTFYKYHFEIKSYILYDDKIYKCPIFHFTVFDENKDRYIISWKEWEEWLKNYVTNDLSQTKLNKKDKIRKQNLKEAMRNINSTNDKNDIIKNMNVNITEDKFSEKIYIKEKREEEYDDHSIEEEYDENIVKEVYDDNSIEEVFDENIVEEEIDENAIDNEFNEKNVSEEKKVKKEKEEKIIKEENEENEEKGIIVNQLDNIIKLLKDKNSNKEIESSLQIDKKLIYADIIQPRMQFKLEPCPLPRPGGFWWMVHPCRTQILMDFSNNDLFFWISAILRELRINPDWLLDCAVKWLQTRSAM